MRVDHGEWEGRKAKELLLDPNSGYAKWLPDPKCIAIPGGGESVQAAQQRAVGAVRDASLTFSDESVLIIGHNHIDALLMCALLKEPLRKFGSHIVEDTLPHLLAADANGDSGRAGSGAQSGQVNLCTPARAGTSRPISGE